MNRHAMIKPLIVLLPVVLLAACTPAPSADAELAGTSLTGSPIGGDFTLSDKTGKAVHWGDFAGKYRIVYFGYTFCPDACPLDVGIMMQALGRFAKHQPLRANTIQPIFITIDPERDTPAKVGEFAAAFGPGLLGLYGTRAQTDVAIKAFRVYAQRGKPTTGGYLMDHSRFAYLMGPKGQPIEALPTDLGADAVVADLEKAVR